MVNLEMLLRVMGFYLIKTGKTKQYSDRIEDLILESPIPYAPTYIGLALQKLSTYGLAR